MRGYMSVMQRDGNAEYMQGLRVLWTGEGSALIDKQKISNKSIVPVGGKVLLYSVVFGMKEEFVLSRIRHDRLL